MAKAHRICDLKVSAARKERLRKFCKIFVSASQEPARNITSTLIPLVTVLSCGSKPTAEESGAVIFQRVQEEKTVRRPQITTVPCHSSKWAPCSLATAPMSGAITFKNLKNMTATPNLCCQVLSALYHFSLQSNRIKYIYNLFL